MRLLPRAPAKFETISENVREYIQEAHVSLCLPSLLEGWEDVPTLAGSVEQIFASELPAFMHASENIAVGDRELPINQASLQIYVYQCTVDAEYEDFSSKGEDGEDIMAATDRELPSREWEGLWESLVYPDDIKLRLLDYIYSTVVFSDADVDCWSTFSNIVFENEHLTTMRIQSTSCRGTESCSCMGLRAQERRACVEHLRRNSPFVSWRSTRFHCYRNM